MTTRSILMSLIRQSILILCSYLMLSSGTVSGSESKNDSYHFSIYPNSYALATYFNIQSDDTYRGVVKKSAFRVRTNYDLSNGDGWQATGIKRVLSLGSIYPWATEVDIYDTRWQHIGMIDGQVVSTAAARFSLYDSEGNLCGIAFLDYSLSTYMIVYPDSDAYPIAELHHHNEIFGQDWWDVIVYDGEQVDERLIRIFAAMVCDIQHEIEVYYAQ